MDGEVIIDDLFYLNKNLIKIQGLINKYPEIPVNFKIETNNLSHESITRINEMIEHILLEKGN